MGKNTKAIKTGNSTIKKIMSFMLIGVASLMIIGFSCNAAWVMSGSNEWELKVEKEGIKVYSLKSPGASMAKFKGVLRLKNVTINQIVASMIDDNNLENCKEWLPTCSGFEAVQVFSPRTLSDANLWRFDLFYPFSPREILLKGHLRQDKQSKAVHIDYIAAPNLAPLNDGCVRVTHFHNSWKYTPLGNNVVEIEHVQDFDMGGMFPDFLLNLGGTDEVFKFLRNDLPRVLNKEEYKNVTFEFIEEYEDNRVATSEEQ